MRLLTIGHFAANTSMSLSLFLELFLDRNAAGACLGACYQTMAAHSKNGSAERILFVHPDLGIGGAERLVIDAAVGLQSVGHTVTILTSYRDKNHCFEEARDGKSHICGTAVRC